MHDDSTRIAGTIIKNDRGYYLLVQETRPDIYELWGLPAGHVDQGESLQQAAIRETFEETGFKTQLLETNPFFESTTSDNHPYFIFSAEITGGDLKVDHSEQLDVKWFNFSDIESLDSAGKLRDKLIFEAVKKAENA